MSVPRRRKPRSGYTRREFLRRGAGAAAVLGLPACGGGSSGGRAPADGAAQTVFRHGVASGDPLQDRVVLWTRISADRAAPQRVEVVMATDPGLTQNLRRFEGEASAEHDWTVKIDADGLAPGTTYYYRFSTLGQDSPVGRTRTLPSGRVDRLRIAVLSCASYAHGFFNAYARVAERADLDLVLHLGDYLYEYGNGEYGDARDYEPAHEILDLEDYRTRHGYYRLEPELQELHRQHPLVCVWDDHESANDAWQGGAQNHQPDLEGDWAPRKAAAQRAYAEWMPIRAPDPARIFRSFTLGDLAELVMLDTRLFARSEPLTPTLGVPGIPFGVFTASGPFLDPARTLLGDEQEAWFIDRLRRTPARWKLIGQQVMFGQLKLLGAANALGLSQYINADQWDGYPVARQRIFDALAGDADTPAVDNAVVLTGDIHTAWAMDLTPDPNHLLPALGGYNALSGEGSRAVEFVATSVTSPGLEDLRLVEPVLRLNNPHLKHVNLAAKGYLLLDLTPARCLGEFWNVDTIATRGRGQHLDAAFETLDGGNRLRAAPASQPRVDAPLLAPRE